MRNANSNLGAAVKAARKTKHLTQLELSEELGITPRHLQAIENENKTPEITFDDFLKVQLRVGEIIACEAVPKSSKLLKETVKFGDEIRTIVSGIAKHYSPEEMVGKKVVFVTNLAPRKICGIESQGMILGAEDENGNFSLVTPEKDVQSGTTLG